MTTSLTPIKLQVTIGNFAFDDPDIQAIGFRYSTRLNEISEASISLGFRNKNGIAKIKELFPFGSSGKEPQTLKVVVKGYKTEYSTIKKDIKLYTGNVVGYGSSKQMGDISVSLNARGPFLRFQQTPLFCPGYHPGEANPLSVNPITTTSKQNELRSMLLTAVGAANNGFDAFKIFIENYEKQLSKLNIASDNAGAIPVFIKAYQKSGGNVLSSEAKKLKIIGDISLAISNMNTDAATVISGILQERVSYFYNNPMSTFWEFLIGIMSTFGLSIVNINDTICGIPSIPLAEIPKNHIINTSDINRIEVSDFPFYSPTRSFVLARLQYQPSTTGDSIYGEYPDSSEPTDQEIKTGVFAKMYDAPAFLSFIKYPASILNRMSDVSKYKNKEKIKELLQELESAKKDHVANLKIISKIYAKYCLMEDKFRQRSGNIVTRFMPWIIPGFPCMIKDPLKIADIKCQILSADHALDCNTGQAISSFSLSHVHYDGEVEPDPFPNPFYPSYNVSGALKEITSIMGI